MLLVLTKSGFSITIKPLETDMFILWSVNLPPTLASCPVASPISSESITLTLTSTFKEPVNKLVKDIFPVVLFIVSSGIGLPVDTSNKTVFIGLISDSPTKTPNKALLVVP